MSRSVFVRAGLFTLVLELVLVAPAWAQGPLQPRDVAAPPADIVSGRLVLPAPADLARSSRSALLPMDLAGTVARFAIPDEGTGSLSIVPLSPLSARLAVSIGAPGEPATSAELLQAAGRLTRRAGTLGPSAPGVAAERLDVHAPSTARGGAIAPAGGDWNVELAVDASAVDGAGPHGFLLASGGGPWRLRSHLTTLQHVNDTPIGVVAWWHAEDGTAPRADVAAVAELHADTPAGPLALSLHDDGRHDDGAPGDGVFGATLPPLPAGEVWLSVRARAQTPGGVEVLRTSQHAFTVVERAAWLTGVASTRVVDELALAVDIEAQLLAPTDALQLSAEVWGTAPDGALVPVTWLSRMVPATAGASVAPLSLRLDARWLAHAGASPPLELRQVRVSDPDTHVPFHVLDRVPLQLSSLPPGIGPGAPVSPITPAMLGLQTGAAQAGTDAPYAARVAPIAPPVPPDPVTGLMLVHGYCSGGDTFPPGDFSGNVLVFSDPDQNRSHDEFAQLIAATGVSAGVDSFGVVGHSQGGAAALHLRTFYFSALDKASGPRRIQAVATPFQGSPLASSLAGLGGIFGIGCGSNDDLSDGGSAVWLSSIPTWARSEVYFWTTQNSGSACNFLTNLFLDSPNDGVVEMSKGQLPGGNGMGHVSGWCHTTGMSNPANYFDSSRNAQMDAQAAR